MAFEILDKTNTGQSWDSLKQAESQVLQTGQKAYQQYASPEKAAQMMKSQLMKTGPSLDLRKQEAGYQEQLSTTPYEYRSPDYMPEVTNPLIRAKMAAQREANIEKNLQTTRATQDIYEGNVADIINAAATNIKAENERISMELDFKKEGYQMALQQYGLVSEAEAAKLADQWKQKEYDLSIKQIEEEKRQFDEQMRLSYQQLAQSGSGGSSSNSSNSDTSRLQKLVDNGRTLVQKATNLDQAGVNWGQAFNTIKSEFPELTDSDVDNLLGYSGGWEEYSNKIYKSQSGRNKNNDTLGIISQLTNQ